MQRSERIDLEIQKRDGGGAIVRRLRSGVDDQIGAQLIDESEQLVSLANVDGVMTLVRNLALQTRQNPTGIPFRSKENRPMVVIDAMDLESRSGKKQRDL